jgi:hypothetical protein
LHFAIGSVICAGIGAALAAVGIHRRSQVEASRSWLQVPGTVTAANIAVIRGDDSTGYAPELTYSYVVNGTGYTGKRIRFNRRQYVLKSRAQKELDRYPVNTGVIVYFDPVNPGDAVLIREATDSTGLIAGGIALFIFAVVIALWSRAGDAF